MDYSCNCVIFQNFFSALKTKKSWVRAVFFAESFRFYTYSNNRFDKSELRAAVSRQRYKGDSVLLKVIRYNCFQYLCSTKMKRVAPTLKAQILDVNVPEYVGLEGELRSTSTGCFALAAGMAI